MPHINLTNIICIILCKYTQRCIFYVAAIEEEIIFNFGFPSTPARGLGAVNGRSFTDPPINAAGQVDELEDDYCTAPECNDALNVRFCSEDIPTATNVTEKFGISSCD